MARKRIHNQTPIEIEEAVLARLKRRETITSIARKCGIGLQTVKAIGQRAGVEIPPPPVHQPPPSRKRIKTMMAEFRQKKIMAMYRGEDPDGYVTNYSESKAARVTAELDIFGSGVRDCMGIECDESILEQVRIEARREEKAKRKGRKFA